MKRAAVTVIFFGALVAFGGCTSSDEACYRDSYYCAPGSVCDAASGECLPTDGANQSCSAPSDCVASYTCAKNGRCEPGDCYFHECVAGFECQSSTGTWQCLPSSAGAAGAAGNQDTPEAGSGGVLEAAGQGG